MGKEIGRIFLPHKVKFRQLLDKLFEELSPDFFHPNGTLATGNAAERINKVAGQNYNRFKNNKNLNFDEKELLETAKDELFSGDKNNVFFEIDQNNLGKIHLGFIDTPKRIPQSQKTTATIIALSLGYMGWEAFINNGNKIPDSVLLNEQKSKRNETSQEKEREPISEKIDEIHSKVGEIEIITKDILDSNKQEKITTHQTDDSKAEDFQQTHKGIKWIVGAVALLALIFAVGHRYIPLFLNNSSYNIAIVPFESYDNDDAKVEDMIRDRLRSLNQIDSLDIKVKVCRTCNPDKNFIEEKIEKWRKYHNADLIVYGTYSTSKISDSIQLSVNYLADKEDVPNPIYKTDSINYTIVNKWDISKGAAQGNIDFIAYYVAGISLLKKKYFNEAIHNFEKVLNNKHAHYLFELLAYSFVNAEIYDKSEYYYREHIKDIISEKDLSISYNSLGSVQFLQNKFEAAEISFHKSLSFNNSENFAFSNLAVLYLLQEKYSMAVEYSNRAISNHSDDVDTWYIKGKALNHLKQYRKTIKCFEKALEKYDTDLDLLFQKGVAHANLHEYDSAINCFNTVTTIKPDYYEAWNNLGKMHYKRRDFKIAVKRFEEAINIKENYFDAIYYQGLSYASMEDYGSAIECFDTVIQIKKDHYKAWKDKGIAFFKLNKYEQAIDCFDVATSINENSHEVWFMKGIAYEKLKEYDNAIKDFNQAIELKKDDYQSYFNIGVIYGKLENFKSAITFFTEVTNIKKDHAIAWSFQGNYYSKLKKHEKAIKCFQEVTKLTPNDFQAWNNLARTYFTLKNCQESIKYFEKAIQIEPTNGIGYADLGWAFLVCGRILEAELLFKKTIELGDKEYSNLNIGHVFLVKGDKEKAIHHYRLGRDNFKSKEKFWEGFIEDFEHLEPYGINKEEYLALIDEIGR